MVVFKLAVNVCMRVKDSTQYRCLLFEDYETDSLINNDTLFNLDGTAGICLPY